MIEIPAGNQEWRLFRFLRPDGRGQLTEGETIQSATVTATNALTGAPVSSLISQVAPHEGSAVRYRIDPGAAGLSPRDRVAVFFSVETSNGQRLTDTLQVRLT